MGNGLFKQKKIKGSAWVKIQVLLFGRSTEMLSAHPGKIQDLCLKVVDGQLGCNQRCFEALRQLNHDWPRSVGTSFKSGRVAQCCRLLELYALLEGPRVGRSAA